jgi:transcriptional regulator with XRE-family HTH domain
MDKHERLKILRILSGHTQASLARVTGTRQPSIASYERGTYRTPEAVELALSKRLLVDPAYLTYGYPALNGKVWEPANDGKGIFSDLESLLPKFIQENKFSHYIYGEYVDGKVAILSSTDGRRCLLFFVSNSAYEAISNAFIIASISPEKHPATIVMVDKRIEQFDISDFDISGITNDFFTWPNSFLIPSSDKVMVRKILHFILDETIPFWLEKAIRSSFELSSNDSDSYELILKSSNSIKTTIEGAVAQLIAKDGSDLIKYVKSEINRVFDSAIVEIKGRKNKVL